MQNSIENRNFCVILMGRMRTVVGVQTVAILFAVITVLMLFVNDVSNGTLAVVRYLTLRIWTSPPSGPATFATRHQSSPCGHFAPRSAKYIYCDSLLGLPINECKYNYSVVYVGFMSLFSPVSVALSAFSGFDSAGFISYRCLAPLSILL